MPFGTKTLTLLLLAFSFRFLAELAVRAEEPAERERAAKHTWTVAGESREAWIVPPRKPTEGGSPVVFAFHGHGGNVRNAARNFRMHEVWPEAIVVYPQGLPTKTRRDPEGARPGWQPQGGANGDRDLQFVDAMWKTIQEKFQPDAQRVFAMGHSNGGGFTYLLWLKRPTMFAAFAPVAAGTATPIPSEVPPRPLIHLAGTRDQIVEFARQKATIAGVKQHNGCAEPGEPWGEGCTYFSSTKGAPVVTYIHDGGHQYPEAGSALIAKFFQEVGKSNAKPAPESKPATSESPTGKSTP